MKSGERQRYDIAILSHSLQPRTLTLSHSQNPEPNPKPNPHPLQNQRFASFQNSFGITVGTIKHTKYCNHTYALHTLTHLQTHFVSRCLRHHLSHRATRLARIGAIVVDHGSAIPHTLCACRHPLTPTLVAYDTEKVYHRFSPSLLRRHYAKPHRPSSIQFHRHHHLGYPFIEHSGFSPGL